MSELRITYRKSAIGYAHDQKATIAALGLRRLHQTVAHQDTPALRGMLRKVRHLVTVDGIPADSPAALAKLALPVTGADGAARANASDAPAMASRKGKGR
jgi:large subunit ribosomal protein L30